LHEMEQLDGFDKSVGLSDLIYAILSTGTLATLILLTPPMNACLADVKPAVSQAVPVIVATVASILFVGMNRPLRDGVGSTTIREISPPGELIVETSELPQQPSMQSHHCRPHAQCLQLHSISTTPGMQGWHVGRPSFHSSRASCLAVQLVYDVNWRVSSSMPLHQYCGCH
jgi:hypothetical protein